MVNLLGFFLPLSAFLKHFYNTIIAIYTTIKEHIKFVKEKSECCVQGVMAGSCESCLSAEQASAVLDAANFTSHSVFKINAVQINAGDLFGGNFK